jgi:TolB-like protein
MPSLIPGFEYDIVISYRHNDNKSGWVTEFVKNLQEELSATIKEPVSVYFDINPHDGLLETHNVDKSLEGKLKCLVFIPILSQTYCDPKSFAWQHEFLSFNKLAGEDTFARDIKLSNGNVSSRVLPIKIHDLDAEDKTMLENELGGVLRPVNFIYKESGVNRPLKSDDNADSNLNKTQYRNQINKVANAVKEIINALKHFKADPGIKEERNSIEVVKRSARKRPALFSLAFFVLMIGSYLSYHYFKKPAASEDVIQKSIAVLPFADMSPGKDQEYLGDGIAEEIITALSGIKDLKVIGRTSSFQFKGKAADLRDIGEKLQVATVLEGSIQKSGDDVRVTAQLIRVEDGSHLWSLRYERKMTDIFAIQDEIATHITEKLRLTLFEIPSGRPESILTKNMEAYEMWLKGNYFLRRGPEEAEKTIGFFQQAIKLDSSFAEAYLGLAWGYFFSFDSGKKAERWLNKIKQAVEKALFYNLPEDRTYEIMLAVYLYEWNWEEGRRVYDKWFSIHDYGTTAHSVYLRIVYGDYVNAIRIQEEVVKKDPLNLEALRVLAGAYMYNKQYGKARKILLNMLEIDPHYEIAFLSLGWNYFFENKFDLALENYQESKKLFPDNRYNLVLYIMTLAKVGQIDRARKEFKILNDDSEKSDIMKAEVYFVFNEPDTAFKLLFEAYKARDPYLVDARQSPIFDPYRSDPRFLELMKKMNFPE